MDTRFERYGDIELIVRQYDDWTVRAMDAENWDGTTPLPEIPDHLFTAAWICEWCRMAVKSPTETEYPDLCCECAEAIRDAEVKQSERIGEA